MNTQKIKDKELFIKTVRSNLLKANLVLDIGSGIKPQKFISPKMHICCDPFKDYVEGLSKEFGGNDKSHLVLNCGWRDVVKIFPNKSVDTIFLLDVIEHLPKREGKELLRKTEEIARKQIVVFTPYGFVKQEHPDGIDAWGMRGGNWQKHLSGWLPNDFNDQWKVFVCPEYHTVDNMSHKLGKPHGAIYAIWTSTINGTKKSFFENLLPLKK